MPKLNITLILTALFLCANFSYARAEGPNDTVLYLQRAGQYSQDMQIKTIRKIPLPKGYHEGLLLDGDKIMVNNGNNINTWVVDSSSGKVLNEISPVASFSEGITIADRSSGKYWLTDWYTKKLHLIKIDNNRMIAESDVSFAPSHPAGVISIQDRVYIITWTRGLFGTRYHLHELDGNGARLRTFEIRDINEPTQMAWDGKDLWITSWFDKRAYRVDIVSMAITGHFRTDIEDTTGIAWDGKYFWLTGTDADLYQMELGLEK